jgi:glycogen phosphorylase
MSPNEATTLLASLTNHLLYTQAKDQYSATLHDRYSALAHTVRDRLIERWIATQQRYYSQDCKRVYYLSAEFLMGRALYNNLNNLGLVEPAREALKMAGFSLEELVEQEPDAGLGNGGLGRLAACFLDSLATLDLPGSGYGIRYEFGMFEQDIRHGGQFEKPDEWLRMGNPWEIARPEYTVPVHFGGRVEERLDGMGGFHAHWIDTETVLGMAYDTPIAGYGTQTVNTLRLWRARASSEFDLGQFNDGDYELAVLDKNKSETISKVLYPSDTKVFGKELRLKQQYFFVTCSLVDIIRRYQVNHKDDFSKLPDKVAIQLNDTHPAVAIPELMRQLIDVHKLPWEQAWKITEATFGYTNHTLLPEALETWPVELFGRVLPRHLSIIYEINRRFLRQVRSRFPLDDARLPRMSLIDEGDGHTKRIRMASLAVVGSHSVNGVAALHTQLLQENLLRDFFEMFPERFNNKTNGVTPRRWLLAANPKLAEAISGRIGDAWHKDLDELVKLVPLADDPSFVEEVRQIKQHNKQRLAQWMAHDYKLHVDPKSIFDVQIKRLHEYKRQLLNLLHVVALYLRIKKDPEHVQMVPRTFLFGGKAAPAYFVAKSIIKLINAVAAVVNHDPQVGSLLKVIFLPNYRVTLAERLFPASDVSEQISTAGKEASGTGNMKFALNGALTIGTLDGANVEIREEVGAENFFLFGLTAAEVQETLRRGYRPRDFYEKDEELRAVIDLINSGFFSPDQPDEFRGLVHDLLERDQYLLLADFRAYADCQKRVEEAFKDQAAWHRMAVLNIAKMGKFSSDRTIKEYAAEIWKAKPLQW